MRIAVAAPIVLALLAGCLATDPSDGPVDCPASPLDQPGLRLVPTTVDPIDDERDNATVFETTNVRTCTLPAIGWHPLHPSGTPHYYLGEIDFRGDLDLGVVAVPGSAEPAGAYLLDISDRAAPTVLAHIPQPGAYVVDAKISDDGNVLYLASQRRLSAPEFASTLPEAVAPAGFTVYDIRDPASPQHVGTVVDEGYGCHMLDPVQVAPTQDAVMCVSNTIKSYLVQRTPDPFVPLGFVSYLPERDGRPTPTELPPAPVAGLPLPLPADPTCSVSVPDQDPVRPGVCALAEGPHDMTAYHEGGAFGQGDSYLVVSHWGEGVKVLDITDAPRITEVGSWDGEGATHYEGNVHTAMMFVVGEHRYIMASPELTSRDSGIPGLWVLDADDLSDLRLVAEWYHPGNHSSQGLYLTTHQWQVAPTGPDVNASDVRVYLSHNHAGVWVLDLGHILQGHDQAAILGFNLARTELREEAVDAVPNAILGTWDVNIVDGYIYGSDRSTGLWVFHYTGDALGDGRLRGFA